MGNTFWQLLIIERFRNPTITITVSEQPHVTSSLSVFVNAKPVESCFEKRVRLVQFLGELLEFKLNKINRYKLPRLKCTHKQDTEGQIPTVVRGNIPGTYPKRSRKTRPVKLRRPTLRKAAITTQKETQHTVKLHGYWTKLFLKHYTMACHTLITSVNPNPV